MKFLVTGTAGFIGFHLCRRLLSEGHQVEGLDNLSDYYDPQLKRDRLAQIEADPAFEFHKLDLTEADALSQLVKAGQFDRIVHLAAQPGVRYSLENPQAYIQSNLVGFGNLLEACRHAKTPHLVFASSSSVYGNNKKVPYCESDPVDHPISLYAATKKSNELMAHSYSMLYGLPITGLRFFTVYGPWGRPDMAPILFTRAILNGESIKVHNHGHHSRDFTFIDDVIEGVVKVGLGVPAGTPDYDGSNSGPAQSRAPYGIYNIGRGSPVKLLDFINTLEKTLGKKAQLEMAPHQPGDVLDTWADCSALNSDFGYEPKTTLESGLQQFIDWYRDYYQT